ncbi:MAG TPA: cupin domain-containing protein [Burkholderiales bacterium]|nr:cupin domain-containing protein [Burkholderiales bacterium]
MTAGKRPRRVVTGHDARGRSVVLMDGESPHSFLLETAGGLRLIELWETRSSPADNSGTQDAAAHEQRIEPVGGGSVFRIIEYPPDSARLKTLDPKHFFHGMGAKPADAATRKHPGMHRTDTVDYCVVLSGEIWAVLDVGEVLLRAGDCLVQRGTHHAWSNRSDQPCTIAFVLVAAKPLAPEQREDL